MILADRKLNVHTFQMNWRFLPLIDVTVDLFLSRDSDTQILPREVAAVNRWLQMNSTFHIIRDHPLHDSQILGGIIGGFSSIILDVFNSHFMVLIFNLRGLWGAKLNQRRDEINRAITKLLSRRPRNGKGMDQLLLGM